MTIQFQLQMHDILAMQQDVINHSRTHDVKGKYFRWGLSIVLLGALLIFLKITIFNVVIGILLAGAFFLLAPMIYTKMTFNRLKKKIEQNDYADLLKPVEMHFTKDGIDRVTGGETDHFPWNEFRHMREDENHYFLYVNDLQGLIIPKHPEIKTGESTSFQENIVAYTTEHLAQNNDEP